MDPLVSVLMSVHNEALEYIDKAVESICQQTYSNVEFIIIDDASDQETYSHLQQLSFKYKCIKLYRNESNLGLTATLNKGLGLATGSFIARMDADDYSCPERIRKQVDYLNSHTEIDILGTGVVSFGQKVSYMSPMQGASNDVVQCDLFFTSSLCHPSVMIRKAFLDRTGLQYDESVKKGQDYDMWERSSICGRLTVLPDVLLYYRLHDRQITSTNRGDQSKTAMMIMHRRIQRLDIAPTDRQMQCHLALAGSMSNVDIHETESWIEKLVEASKKKNFIDTIQFKRNLEKRLVLIKLKKHIVPTFNEWPVLLGIVWSRILMRYNIAKYTKRISKTI